MVNMQQNDDGSWSEAKPLGWSPGLDWEVYLDEKPKRADLYDKAERLARVTAHTKLGLRWAMRKVDKKHGHKTRVFGARVI